VYEKACPFSVAYNYIGKSEVKKPLYRPRLTKDNIKMDLKEIMLERVDRMQVA
jgi:hypothetical protein